MRYVLALAWACLVAAASHAQLPEYLIIDGPNPTAEWGRHIAPCGDVDGDGTIDLVLGVKNGPVPVISGRTGAVILSLAPPVPGEEFGYSVCGAGDQNGDGIPDIAVGAPAAHGDVVDCGYLVCTLLFDQPNAGIVYVFSGADGSQIESWVARADPAHLVTWPNARALDGRFGSALANMGDQNGDGIDEVAVSGWSVVFSVFGGSGTGVRIIDGATDEAILTIPGSLDFGYSLANIGDVNGNGMDDVAVGTPEIISDGYLNPGGGGKVEVYDAGTGALLQSWARPFDNSRFGVAVSSAGDIDGDGVNDLIVGTTVVPPPMPPLTSPPTTSYLGGKVEIFSVTSGQVLRTHSNNSAALDLFGISVTGGQDFDADGVPDYAAGVLLQQEVRVWSGATGAEIDVYHLPGPLEWFGAATVALPDMNGDGLPDLAASAPRHLTAGGPNAGRVSLFSPLGALVYGDDGAPGQTLSISWNPGPTNPAQGLGLLSGASPLTMGAALVAFDAGDTTLGGVHLLVDISDPNSLLIAPITYDAMGRFVFPIQLNHPALDGVHLAIQGLSLDPSAPGGVATSPGLSLMHN